MNKMLVIHKKPASPVAWHGTSLCAQTTIAVEAAVATRGRKDAGWQRENMSRNRLAILPGLTHYDNFLSPKLSATVVPFLDGKVSSANWANTAGKKL